MPGLLEHSPARIVQELLIGAGLATDPERSINGAWPAYVGREPDRPDELIRVSNTQGRDFGTTQVDGELQEHQGIQILIRSTSEERGYLKAQRIAVFLDAVKRSLVEITQEEAGTGTSEYILHAITRSSNVMSLGLDAPVGKRHLFTLNAVCAIRLCC